MSFQEFLDIIKLGDIKLEFDDILQAHPEYTNAQDENGWTALMYAAERGNSDLMVKLVRTYRADVTIKNKDGKTAYDLAKEYYEEEKRLYDEHPDVYIYHPDVAEDDLKLLKDAIEKKKALPKLKDATALQRLSKQGLTGKLPPELEAEVLSKLTGKTGTTKHQIASLKAPFGRGRRTKKTRRAKRTYRKRTVRK